MKKSFIGIVIGIILLVISIYFLITSSTNQILEVNETVIPNNSKSYTLYANDHVLQLMNITGNKFDLSLSTPKNGLQIPLTTHINPVELSWFHLSDGISNITIQNIDDSDLEINAIFTTSIEASMIMYFIIMAIIGAAIIGFSIIKKQSIV